MKTFIVQFEKEVPASDKETQKNYLPDFECLFDNEKQGWAIAPEHAEFLNMQFPFAFDYMGAVVLAAQRMNKIAKERSLKLVAAHTINEIKILGFVYYLE